jgi:hypothetical protein
LNGGCIGFCLVKIKIHGGAGNMLAKSRADKSSKKQGVKKFHGGRFGNSNEYKFPG